ncbi:MAG: hypothetical protein H7X83_02565 [Verrucomicrobia bacterium]|nr:hypothetical protein [Deltaproteobacteria bacterium]
MGAKRIFSLYSQNSGLEITPEIKINAGKGQSEGRVQLRFFLLQSPGSTGKTTQLKFLLEPWEAFDLALRMDKTFKDGGKEKIVHKFTPAGSPEMITSLTVEKWERAGKSGLGIAVGRGDAFISVPVGKVSTSRFLYAAEFLRFLSTRQGWVDREAA